MKRPRQGKETIQKLVLITDERRKPHSQMTITRLGQHWSREFLTWYWVMLRLKILLLLRSCKKLKNRRGYCKSRERS
jgi:hypothetical protein